MAPTNIEALKTELAAGGDHIGDFVFWTLDDARQDVQAVRRAFEAEGLAAHLPGPPTWPKALKRAVEDAKRGKDASVLITLAEDKGGRIVYAVLSKHVDGRADVSTIQEGKLVFLEMQAPTPPDFSFSTLGHPVVTEIKAGAEGHATRYTAEDLGKAIVSGLRALDAFSLRPAGGVYFVPRPGAEGVRALQRAVGGVGRCSLAIVPVHRSAEGTPALAQAAQGSLEAEVAEVQKEILDFAAEVQAGGSGPRAETLERRLERFEAIRAKARVYETVLSFSANGIVEGLGKLEKVIEAIVVTTAGRSAA